MTIDMYNSAVKNVKTNPLSRIPIQEWLRDRHGIVCYVSLIRQYSVLSEGYEFRYDNHIKSLHDNGSMLTDHSVREQLFLSWDDALEDVLLKSLKLVHERSLNNH